MRPRPQIPAEIEEFRDERWRREATRQVETAFDAERFIEQVGFAACLTDSRRPGPSLYLAVCGRRDAVRPRMVPYFHAISGVRRSEEKRRLSRHAQAVLRVLRREWEMSTGDLRDESGV